MIFSATSLRHATSLGAAGKDHHDNQNDSIDQHAVIVQAAQHFGQNGQDGRCNHGAADAADAAQNHEDQNVDGGVVIKLFATKEE